MINGMLGRKVGMTQIFAANGTVVPVTAIVLGPCYVTQIRTVERDGYEAVQIGFGEKKRLNKPEKGHLKNLPNLAVLREVKIEPGSEVSVGQKFDASLFKVGELVDVTGTSKGKGFAGVVKRHHFKGGPKTHGQSDRHRAPGSSGATTTPGRVLKGTRRAGRMGNERKTIQALEVVRIDPERNLVLVKGSVPGSKDGLVLVRRSIKARFRL